MRTQTWSSFVSLTSFFVYWFALIPGLGSSARAQQSPKIPRIGYISGTGTTFDQGPYVEALRKALRDLGYAEGKDFVIEYRGAGGDLDRVPGLVTSLIESKVDVIVAPVPGAIRAAKQGTKTIPVVMVTGMDPVAGGIIESLARPGANITGVVTLAQDLNGKRLQLLTEIVPRFTRVAILWTPDDRAAAINFKQYQGAAAVLKIEVQSLEVARDDPDLDGTFKAAVKARANGLITITTAKLFMQQKRIADLAIKARLASMFQGSTWVDSGGLMSYSTDEINAFHRAATYVHKILKGAKPAELPVEQATKFELVINLKTARQIGRNVPQEVLARADRVIK
jgi:ABC-type uncharacterized transport system substrate-binding protein